MGKGFSSPAQFRGEDIRTALIRNWRQLVTFINTWVVTLESDGTDVILPGDLTVTGNLGVNNATPQRPEITGSRANTEQALADLLSSLDAMGIITDSSTT